MNQHASGARHHHGDEQGSGNPFPNDFLWGASTSGHQTEGGNYNQWTVWELKNAPQLARTATKRLGLVVNDWPKVKHHATDPANYISGKGVDHFHRYKEDFDIAEALGLNAFRFSIEWSRLEPQEGVWDDAAIDHYHNYIAELKRRGIEPMVNLWHWTHPVWFDEKGGFGKSGNVGYFLKFVDKFIKEFGDEVRYVITLNEPNNYVLFGYIAPKWPPAKFNPLRGLLVYRNLILAHRHAYALLKHAKPHLQVGLAYQVATNMPKDRHKWLDKLVAWAVDYIGNWLFLNRVKRQMDFMGLNYYFMNYFDGFKLFWPERPRNDLGWYMEPSALSEVLTKAWLKYHIPIIVTENGVADGDDQYRQWWLKESMLAMLRAQKAGAVIKGYMYWSLLDNFEWSDGWWPHFGLVKVDREHGMKRTVRPSAHWWAHQIDSFRKR